MEYGYSIKSQLKKNGFPGNIIKNAPFLIMVLPGLVFFITFNYLPLLGLIIAFKQYRIADGFFKSKFIGLKNFEFFFNTPDALVITRNTVLYNLAFIVLGLLVSMFFAISLSELTSVKLSKFYQSSMFLPYFLSWITISYLAYSFLSAEYGVINNVIFKALGKPAVNWYAEAGVWPYIIIILNLWKYSGYSCVIYLAAIMGIDNSFYEAASIDGASKWQQIIKITIPSIMPVITMLTLLSIGRIFNSDFGLFYQASMQQGGGMLKPTTEVIDTYVYQAMVKLADVGMASAAGLYQSVVGFVLVLGSNLFVKKINSDYSLF